MLSKLKNAKKSKIKKLKRWMEEEGFWRAFWRATIIFFCKLEYLLIKIRRKIDKNYISNSEEVIYIPTEIIKYSTPASFHQIKEERNFKDKNNFEKLRKEGISKRRKVGKIKNGSWDAKKIDFQSQQVFTSFKQKFIKNKTWENTLYYGNSVRFKEGSNASNCNSWKMNRRIKLKEWDNLYRQIKKNGYKSQKEINGTPTNEIEVAISRDGEILFVDGRHRLSIAKILGIKEIPVIVNVWHKDYIDWVKKEYNLKNPTPKEAIKPILDRKFYKKT